MKRKISLGISFLLILLISSGALGIYNLWNLSRDAKEIIKDNYETIYFCQQMQGMLDSLPAHDLRQRFNATLALQQLNITEEDEGEITARLRRHWIEYNRRADKKDSLSVCIRTDLGRIEDLNMLAIQRKNALAQATADNSLLLISVISALVILITLAFLIEFPSYIADPLQKLIKGIREITNKNYSHKIVIRANDELQELADAFNVMAAQLNEFEKTNIRQLLFQKARAEAVINSLTEASIGIDIDQTVLFANAEALQLLNCASETLVGKTVAEAGDLSPLFKFIVSPNQSTPFKILLDRKDLFFTKQVTEILKDGQHLGTLFTITNITSFREKDIAKTNFLATISHELKTPLSSTDIALTLLSNEKIGFLNEDQKQILGDLKGENNRLIRLVSELLNLAQVETGQIQVTVKDTSLLEIVEYAAEALKTQKKEKEVLIDYSGIAASQFVKADQEKAVWVLVNLLSNAIRYSPPQSTVFIRSDLSVPGIVIVSVEDAGPGIPAGFENQLFQRFYKLPGGNSKGSGLGLSIAKEFMEAMQGKIYLDTQQGKGTKFCLEFRK